MNEEAKAALDALPHEQDCEALDYGGAILGSTYRSLGCPQPDDDDCTCAKATIHHALNRAEQLYREAMELRAQRQGIERERDDALVRVKRLERVVKAARKAAHEWGADERYELNEALAALDTPQKDQPRRQ